MDALRHNAPHTWQSRDAPLHDGGGLGSALTWRQRAALHRAELGPGFHKPVAQRNLFAEDYFGLADEYKAQEDAVEDASGDISAADLIVSDNDIVVIPEDEDKDIDEGYGDDWWGLAMRVDIERFIAYKNVQLKLAAQADESVARVFENTAVWSIIAEILTWERKGWRRSTRGRFWPDTMLSPAVMSREEIDELKVMSDRWTQALDMCDDIGHLRQTLQLLPVDFMLEQLIADALVSAGALQEARWSLLLVVGAASRESEPKLCVGEAQFAPPRIGWDDRCKCDYIKAQQCTRFGRLAVISAQAISSLPEVDEYTPELCRIRAEQRSSSLSQELAGARRHLVDARKLYKAELVVLDGICAQVHANGPVGACLLWGTHEASNFRMALRCGYLGATGLLAACYSLGCRVSEALATYEEAISDVSALLRDAADRPRLQRLLAAEREKMLDERRRLTKL